MDNIKFIISLRLSQYQISFSTANNNTLICSMINLFEPPADRTLILTVPNAHLYRLLDSTKKLLSENKLLEVYYYPNEKLYVLAIDLLRYSMSKEIPFVRQGEKFAYTFPDIDSRFYLELDPATPPDIVKTFEEVINNNATLIVNLPTKPNVVARAIYSGANFIKWAFIRAGEVVAYGLGTVGGYIISKIRPRKEEVKIPRVKEVVHGVKVAADETSLIKDKAVFSHGFSKKKQVDYAAEEVAGGIAQAYPEKYKGESKNVFIQTGKAIYKGAIAVTEGIAQGTKVVCIH
eukprot:TRINITY_DN89803_c0_g1_i1.p1 TRINITY_DN89803_c0_g1~~TRINITY_DN89803_c0_g1_i1.p1  ORF type:complete len:319 (+),score=14.27 TRINITY_DN89803_c0_g1_i1:88-957(+)